MAKEKTSRALKKGNSKACPVKECPAEAFYNRLRGIFDDFSKKREKAFKHSERWEHLKEGLIEAAGRGIKHILVKTTEKEFGEGKYYTEWEIDSFVNEYELIYCFDENRWRIYWF